jgi:hypothetical protein
MTPSSIQTLIRSKPATDKHHDDPKRECVLWQCIGECGLLECESGGASVRVVERV